MEPHQPPFRAAAGLEGLNIERELTPWQLREKTEARTDANAEREKINLDKTPKTSCTERNMKENIIKNSERSKPKNISLFNNYPQSTKVI